MTDPEVTARLDQLHAALKDADPVTTEQILMEIKATHPEVIAELAKQALPPN